MAWIEQTKKGSRKSGGPQYYLQGLKPATHAALEALRRCSVRLWTPYGVVESGLKAVSAAEGSVGHDRVQSGGRVPSIADQIAHWFRLKKNDIENVEFDDSFDEREFVIRPSQVKFFGRSDRRRLYPPNNPLSITDTVQSELFRQHVKSCVDRRDLTWARDQIMAMVDQHDSMPSNIDERDVLRASGALSKLGIDLGIYRRQGIDCPDATFNWNRYPAYSCPVEIEERSTGFRARHHAQHRRQRIVLLCMFHDAPEMPRGHVDVLELRQLGQLLGRVA